MMLKVHLNTKYQHIFTEQQPNTGPRLHLEVFKVTKQKKNKKKQICLLKKDSKMHVIFSYFPLHILNGYFYYYRL